MASTQIKIRFLPDEKKIKVSPGIKLIDAADQAGIYLDTPCGGNGICGKCRVQLIPVNSATEPIPTEFFSESEWNDGWRLACQTVITQNCTVRIPESLRKYQHKILESGLKVEVFPEPNIQKYFVTLPLFGYSKLVIFSLAFLINLI
ncbi:MAG: 2Fe-2S iron-sulfur cluster-binding protein [bacterium]